jgi:putative ABC transport system substrate-binding protein
VADRQGLVQGLHDLGWEEGRDFRIEARSIDGMSVARQEVDFADLVRSAPDLITVAGGASAVALLRHYTRTIPIVFAALIGDPVVMGLVSSRARPGGNITGFANYENSLSGKWLQLLKEMAPEIGRVAVVFDTNYRAFFANPFLPALHAAASSLGVELSEVPLADAAAIDGAIAAFAREPQSGVIAVPDRLTLASRAQILAAVAAHRLPAIYTYRIIAESGGLMSYGADGPAQFRQAADYVDRILKGADPGELPVQTPTRYELVINLKTAAALGLTIPPTLLATADEVVE